MINRDAGGTFRSQIIENCSRRTAGAEDGNFGAVDVAFEFVLYCSGNSCIVGVVRVKDAALVDDEICRSGGFDDVIAPIDDRTDAFLERYGDVKPCNRQSAGAGQEIIET